MAKNPDIQAFDGPARGNSKLATADATDRLCEAILTPMMLTEIALEWGVKVSTLRMWIAADPARSARAREARKMAAMIYSEQAEKAIVDAVDELALKKARELAHHLRWKASKADPGEYGEKLEVGNPGDFSRTSDEELIGRLDALMPGLGEAAREHLKTGGGHAVH